ncbi:MAG: AhpC/TSA family protein [Tannerellaceae bacterium]|nr:AhpC/TSA family protein [Tannerellaceae bacterium]
MKTSIASFLLAIFFLSACNSTPKEAFTIDGEVNAESGTVYLQGFRNKMFFIIDSAQIENGKFHFSGTVDRPDLYGLTLNREETFSPWFIFLENKPVTVQLNTEDKRNYTVTGSPSHDLFVEYRDADKNTFNIESFIAAHPAAITPAYILYREYSYRLSADEIESALALMDPSLNDTEYVEALKEHVEVLRSVEPGKPAPNFSATSPEGETIELHDRLGNGYVLLDFWASWCGPCRRENPNVVEAYKKYHSKGFDVFGVSLDRAKDPWVEAIDKDNLTWTHVSDLKFWDSAPAKLYGVRAIPANFLIDPQGNIVAKNLTGEDLQEKLAEIYGK